MSAKKIEGIIIASHPQEQETVELIKQTCARALQLAQEMWALEPPENCHIHVMTSWWKFFFGAAPLPWKIFLVVTFPLWAARARRTWPYAAAWTQRYGKRVVIGVKPPRILEQSNISIGIRMFVEESDTSLKLRHVSCHELIHACSAHLQLPMWLNEGIATVTVDRYLDKPTILEETLKLLREFQPKAPPPTYRELSRMKGKAIVYHTTRGYWLTRFLFERHPDFLRGLISKRRSIEEIAHQTADEVNLDPDTFWREIDDVLADYFLRDKR